LKINIPKTNLPAPVVVPEVIEAKEEKNEIVFDAETKRAISERLSPENAQLVLDALLQKAFPPKQIQKLIADLCSAEDIRMTKDGSEYRTPNWEARDKGLNKVLNLLRFIEKQNGMPSDVHAAKIVFQVINHQEVHEK